MQIQTLIYFNLNQFKSSQFKLIQLFSILFWFVLFKQLCQYLSYFRSNFSSPPWSWVFRYKINSFQFHTHAHFIPAKKDFWYIKVRRYNIINFILFYSILSFVNKTLSILSICIVSGQTFFRHQGLRYKNTKSNLLQLNSTFSILDLFQVKGQTFSLHHGLRSYYTNFNSFEWNWNKVCSFQFYSIYINSIHINSNQFNSIFELFQV